MRFVFYPLVFLTFGLLICVIWLGFHPSSWIPQIQAAFSATPAPAEAPKTASKDVAAKKPTPFANKRAGHGREPEVSPVEAPEVAPAAGSPSRPAEMRYRFPLAADIRAGTARSAILALFGPPEATVTGSDLGQLREKFVYTDKTTGKRTHVSLVNGSVTTAETFAQ